VAIHSLYLVISGGVSIPFGIALLELKSQFGPLATGAGVIGIITGACLLTIILSILGILLFIPWYILTSMILFRAAKKFETKSTNS
jgi:hypothetical protein